MNPSAHIAPEDESSIKAEIERAQHAGPTMFQGKPLWPYAPSTRSWFHQGVDLADLVSHWDLAFCYVHWKRGGATAQEDVLKIMPLIRNGNEYRMAIGTWLDELSGGDLKKADEIMAEAAKVRAEMTSLARKTEIVASDPEGTVLKPLGAWPPAPTNSSRNSLLPNTDTVPTSPTGNSPSGDETPCIIPIVFDAEKSVSGSPPLTPP